MEEILRIIVEYVSIWAPSLVAILGVVTTIITALKKVSEAFENLKKDKTLEKVNNKLTQVVSENEELIRTNKLLLEQITKIKNYSDVKKEK